MWGVYYQFGRSLHWQNGTNDGMVVPPPIRWRLIYIFIVLNNEKMGSIDAFVFHYINTFLVHLTNIMGIMKNILCLIFIWWVLMTHSVVPLTFMMGTNVILLYSLHWYDGDIIYFRLSLHIHGWEKLHFCSLHGYDKF